MTLPVAPELFDVLGSYTEDIEAGKITPTPKLASTSPALTFCENFYAQFFQNVAHQEITAFNNDTKKEAVRLRLRMKKTKTPKTPAATIQLITWFEKLCDIYPNVLALGYGGGSTVAFVGFHKDYLLVLLDRISAWAKVFKYTDIERKATSAVSDLRKAIKTITK